MLSSTIADIMGELISSSPACPSIKSENIDDTTNDYSPPNTPFSFNSFSNQTSFVNTAPNSPASSIATTTNASITTKRGRGRPAKTHSDIPDLSQFEHLSESEQKKMLERAKNNEASRKSRLKHKERDNALEREEIELTNRNMDLKIKLEEYTRMERKLKAALKRQIFQS